MVGLRHCRIALVVASTLLLPLPLADSGAARADPGDPPDPPDATAEPLVVPRKARRVVGASLDSEQLGLALRQLKAAVGDWTQRMPDGPRAALAVWWEGASKEVRQSIERAGAILEHLVALRIEAISTWPDARQVRFLRHAGRLRDRLVGTAATLRKRRELAAEALSAVPAEQRVELAIPVGAALDLCSGEAAARAGLAARRLVAELVVETNAGPQPLERAFAADLDDASELLGAAIAGDPGRRAVAAIHIAVASGGWTSPGEMPVLEGPDGNARSVAALLRETGPRQGTRALALLDLLATLEAVGTGAATVADLEAAASAVERLAASDK